MFGVEQKVAKAARKAAAFVVGGVLVTVGVAFLTVAGWIALSEAQSQLFAATVIGLVYITFAGIALLLGATAQQSSFQSEYRGGHQDLSPMQLVALSFVQGLEQGRTARRGS